MTESCFMSTLPFNELTSLVNKNSIAFTMELFPVPFSPKSSKDLESSWIDSCLIPLNELISISLIFKLLILSHPYKKIDFCFYSNSFWISFL